MLAERHPLAFFAIAVVVAFALIVAGQWLATASAPPLLQTSQSKLVGQAGFAYLGGLRMMGAGLLWGRLDAQFHQYQTDTAVQNRLDLLPSIRLVQLLNPQLEQPYYYTSYILMLRGRMSDALELAREGIQNSPTSGLLRANYAQLLFIQDKKKNLPLMLEQARAGLSSSATYVSADDQYEAYGIFRAVYLVAGDKATASAIATAQKQINDARTGGSQSPAQGFFGLLNAWTNSATSTEP
jgi:hypothetical protein